MTRTPATITVVPATAGAGSAGETAVVEVAGETVVVEAAGETAEAVVAAPSSRPTPGFFVSFRLAATLGGSGPSGAAV